MDVLIWGGISMTNKYTFDTVDRLFKDLCWNSKPFGGKEIIVPGDFRQTLPILCHGGRAQIVESSVKSCKISQQFHYSKLYRRIWEYFPTTFKKWLLNVGEGQYFTKFEGNKSL